MILDSLSCDTVLYEIDALLAEEPNALDYKQRLGIVIGRAFDKLRALHASEGTSASSLRNFSYMLDQEQKAFAQGTLEYRQERVAVQSRLASLTKKLIEIGQDTAVVVGCRSFPAPKVAISAYIGSKDVDRGLYEATIKAVSVYGVVQLISYVAPGVAWTPTLAISKTVDVFAKEARKLLPRDAEELDRPMGIDPMTGDVITLRQADMILQMASLPAEAISGIFNGAALLIKRCIDPTFWEKVGESILENAKDHSKLASCDE